MNIYYDQYVSLNANDNNVILFENSFIGKKHFVSCLISSERHFRARSTSIKVTRQVRFKLLLLLQLFCTLNMIDMCEEVHGALSTSYPN